MSNAIPAIPPDAVEVTAIVSVSPAPAPTPEMPSALPPPPPLFGVDVTAPPPSIKGTIMARVKKESSRFSILFLLGTTLLASWHYTIAAYGDIDDYYTLAGTQGPFAVSIDPTGKITRGADTASFGKGESVGWDSEFCAVPGKNFTGKTEMVRLSQDGMGEAIENSRTTHFSGDAMRCGERIYALRVPDEAVPGVYELRRALTFREGTLWPLHAHFPAIPFRVVGEPPTTGTGSVHVPHP